MAKKFNQIAVCVAVTNSIHHYNFLNFASNPAYASQLGVDKVSFKNSRQRGYPVQEG